MGQSVILFDGVCTLCQGSVQFIIKRDGKDTFRFASLQSDVARELLSEFGESHEELKSIVLIQEGRLFVRSDAALRIARRLRFPWPVWYAAIILPRFIRDAAYNFIARNRYKWFGKKEECMVPTPELKSKFL